MRFTDLQYKVTYRRATRSIANYNERNRLESVENVIGFFFLSLSRYLGSSHIFMHNIHISTFRPFTVFVLWIFLYHLKITLDDCSFSCWLLPTMLYFIQVQLYSSRQITKAKHCFHCIFFFKQQLNMISTGQLHFAVRTISHASHNHFYKCFFPHFFLFLYLYLYRHSDFSESAKMWIRCCKKFYICQQRNSMRQ